MPNKYYEINPNVAYRIIDEEAFIITTFNSTLHTLNKVGTFIWKKLEEKKSLSDLIDDVCEEFDVDKDVAEKDIFLFIQELLKKEMVREVE